MPLILIFLVFSCCVNATRTPAPEAKVVGERVRRLKHVAICGSCSSLAVQAGVEIFAAGRECNDAAIC